MKEEKKKKQAVSFFFFFKDSGPVCNDTIKRHTDTLTWGQKCSIIKKKKKYGWLLQRCEVEKTKKRIVSIESVDAYMDRRESGDDVKR